MSEAPVHPVKLAGVHHAAYRCKDAKETVEWYGKVLGMDYTTAFAEDHVPSTGDYDPYMHVFLDAGNGNILAFFELPNQKDMGRDENTPAWVQHLAFKLGSEEELLAAKKHVESLGIEVLGPTHRWCRKMACWSRLQRDRSLDAQCLQRTHEILGGLL